MTIICAFMSGVTIILSRSMNGWLAKKSSPYQSTFYNYLTGFITSIIIFLFVFDIPSIQFQDIILSSPLLIGSIIGVFNILILNIVTSHISPIKLTLISFISQLLTGILFDYFFYHLFSIQKILGCSIVLTGFLCYQWCDGQSNK